MNVMAGKVDLADQDESIRSACQLPIYQAAISVLKLPDKEKRRDAINSYPEKIRFYIEAEAKRIWMSGRKSHL